MASAGRWSVLESWLPKTVALPAPRSPEHGWAKSAPSGRASLSSRSEPIFRLGKTQVSFPQRSEIWQRELEKKLPGQNIDYRGHGPSRNRAILLWRKDLSLEITYENAQSRFAPDLEKLLFGWEVLVSSFFGEALLFHTSLSEFGEGSGTVVTPGWQ